MMVRIFGMAYIALCVLLVFGLYTVKLDTKALEKERVGLERDIVRTRHAIGELEAEWAARTAPDFLGRLVADHLPALRPTEPYQLARLADVPLRPPITEPETDLIEDFLSMVELRASTAQKQSTPRERPTL